MANTLNALAASFRSIKVDSAHRQMGRRALKDAASLGDRNPARVDELLARAAGLLPYAQAAR